MLQRNTAGPRPRSEPSSKQQSRAEFSPPCWESTTELTRPVSGFDRMDGGGCWQIQCKCKIDWGTEEVYMKAKV